MPRRYVHQPVGIGAAAVVGAPGLAGLTPVQAVVEMVGLGWGGLLGSRLPDQLDPPNRPGHWGFAHSVSVATLAVHLTVRAGQMQAAIRSLADELCAARPEFEEAPVGCCLMGVAEILVRLGAGFAVGLSAGYASHLVLDQLQSKSSLPLICRGI